MISQSEIASIFRLILQILLFSCASVNAQTVVSPLDEKFQKADGLITPWVDGGCIFDSTNAKYIPDGCIVVTTQLLKQNGTVTLYNRDGSAWSNVNVIESDRENFRKLKPEGFEPFADSQLVLRISAESENWIEVESNRRTAEVKYILKADPRWIKRDWQYFFDKAAMVTLNKATTKLMVSPGGEIDPRTEKMSFDQVIFRKLDGEWMYVEAFDLQNRYFGWIRYRNRQDLLVGCWLNKWVVPE